MATKQLRKIDRMHAMFGIEVGNTCGECVNLVRYCTGKRTFWKCAVYGLTMSESSDWRKGWTACKMFDHEYSGRPVIEIETKVKEPDRLLDGQIGLFQEAECESEREVV